MALESYISMQNLTQAWQLSSEALHETLDGSKAGQKTPLAFLLHLA